MQKYIPTIGVDYGVKALKLGDYEVCRHTLAPPQLRPSSIHTSGQTLSYFLMPHAAAPEARGDHEVYHHSTATPLFLHPCPWVGSFFLSMHHAEAG